MKVEILMYVHTRILFKNSKEWTVSLWNSMDELQNNSAGERSQERKTV